MANAELLIAHRGSSHVLQELWAQANQAQYGADNYVFPFANNFGYTIVDNTHVTVKKGIAMIQGRPAILQADVTLVIENGATNYFRKDLICMRLDRTDGIENANVVVVKGTPVLSGAVDPAYNVGDFNTTVNIVDYPLLRVNVNGLVIGTVDTLFTVKTTIDSLKALIDSKQNSLYGDILTSGNLDTVVLPGAYFINATNLTNQPIAKIGDLIVFSARTNGSSVVQMFITNDTHPQIFTRVIGKNWEEIITTQSQKQGSVLLTGSGVNYVQIFTLTSLRTMFGVGVEKTASDFVILVTNGDEAVTNNRVLGSAINSTSGICWVNLSSNLSGQIRVNYIVSMK